MHRTAATVPPLATLCAAAALLFACGDPPVTDVSGKVTANPTELAFGTHFVGDRVVREVELRSEARAPLALAVASAPGSFLVEPAEVELLPGGSERIRVIFAPDVPGEAGGSVVMGHGESRISIEVQGVAVGRLLEAPAEFDFGRLRLGTAAEEAIRLVNRSTLPVTLVASVEGDTSAFRADGRPLEIPAGATGELKTQFAPQQRGAASATLELFPCEQCQPLRVALRGEGLLDRVMATPSAIDFGTLIAGGSREVALQLENRGDLARTVARWEVSSPFSAENARLPLTIEPEALAAFTIGFAPVAPGDFYGSLRALDQEGDQVVAIPLVGAAVASRVTVDPTAISFGTRPVGSQTSRTLTVKVEGEEVDLTHATIEGGSEFKVVTSFPVHVGDSLEVELRYAPTAAGSHQGTLVLGTSHPLSPELRVPLTGTGFVAGPCRILVPSTLSFGLVPAGTTRHETLVVTNGGTGECRIDNFQLEAAPGPFAVDPVATPVYLVPGAALEVGVHFAAPVDRFETFRRTLGFTSNDPNRARVDIWLSGASLDGVLRAIPDPVDFGSVAIGATSVRQLELRNEGTTTLLLKNVALKMGSDPAFATRVVPPLPSTLVPGAGIAVGLEFAPDTGTVPHAFLEVALDGSTEPMRVALVGTVITGPCQGDDCHSPWAICPGTVVTEVTKQVRLGGNGIDPDNDTLTCSWQLLSGPAGSRAEIAPGGPCAIDFTADLVGEYRFELTVTDPAGNDGSCVTVVKANPYSGLWLETIWDLEADVDLHLLHPGHHAGIDPFDAWSWAGTDGADCFYWTCRKGVATLSWPDSPGPEDDPSLDVDSQDFGPENIRIDVPNRTHPYWIGVHWLYNPLLHPTVQVTTNVYCGGVRAASETVTLVHREHAVLGKVDVNPDGTCVFTPSAVRLGY